METHQHSYNFNEQFDFSGKPKTWSLIAILIGVIAIGYGFFINGAERTFANLLLMSYYLTCVCAAGTCFLAIQYVTQSGWSAGMIRVPQAFSSLLPVASLILLAVCATGLFTHNLYHHWFGEGLTDPNSSAFDPLIAKKAAFLNAPGFLLREVIFMAAYSFFAVALSKFSYNEDLAGGLGSYNKSFRYSAIFLVVFGFTSPIWIFDTIMSLEAHWFSTMFGWYNFAALWVSGLCAITLTIILLKKGGYMNWVNTNHLHDMGKLIMGFSIFWCYVWFAQFMLIYYANIPEETVYFYKRWENYEFWWYLNLVLNFLSPVLLLMDRDNKRQENILLTVSIVVLCGHWVDYYQMIMPGTVDEHNGFGIIEIGTALGFVGLFTFTVLSALSKKPLIAKNHPFLQESLNHHL